jgi:hypothetical protein
MKVVYFQRVETLERSNHEWCASTSWTGSRYLPYAHVLVVNPFISPYELKLTEEAEDYEFPQ